MASRASAALGGGDAARRRSRHRSHAAETRYLDDFRTRLGVPALRIRPARIALDDGTVCPGGVNLRAPATGNHCEWQLQVALSTDDRDSLDQAMISAPFGWDYPRPRQATELPQRGGDAAAVPRRVAAHTSSRRAIDGTEPVMPRKPRRSDGSRPAAADPRGRTPSPSTPASSRGRYQCPRRDGGTRR